jgi:hypothetical protein
LFLKGFVNNADSKVKSLKSLKPMLYAERVLEPSKETTEMKFKPKKQEVFLGDLKCEVDKKTAEELSGHVLLYRRLVNGVFFYHYCNGDIEIRPMGEVMNEMCEDIRNRTKRGL